MPWSSPSFLSRLLPGGAARRPSGADHAAVRAALDDARLALRRGGCGFVVLRLELVGHDALAAEAGATAALGVTRAIAQALWTTEVAFAAVIGPGAFVAVLPGVAAADAPAAASRVARAVEAMLAPTSWPATLRVGHAACARPAERPADLLARADAALLAAVPAVGT